MIELYDKRFANWKRNFLSKEGQLTLVKCTLSNIPIYYFTALPLPVKVARKIERIQCHFLWGDDDERRRYHLVNWKEVKKPNRAGGLGIRPLVEMNKALHGKWLWRYMNEEGGLWKGIVEVRWGRWEGGGAGMWPVKTREWALEEYLCGRGEMEAGQGQ